MNDPDVHPCPLCHEPLDWAGEDSVYSWMINELVHRDCLMDSGEAD